MLSSFEKLRKASKTTRKASKSFDAHFFKIPMLASTRANVCAVQPIKSGG